MDIDTVVCLILFSFLTVVSGVTDWPAGFYALPKPKRGCPGSSDIWQETSIFFNISATNILLPKLWNHFHVSSQLTGDIFKIDICTRTQGSDVGSDETNSSVWPAGRYCTYNLAPPPAGVSNNTTANSTSSADSSGVYNESYNCPNGLTEGALTWPFPAWSADGALSPYGSSFSNATESHYCCQKTGDTDTAIELPTERPFLLFPLSNKCQRVKDMSVVIEKIEWNFNRGFYSRTQTKETRPFIAEGNRSITQFYCFYSKEIHKAQPIMKNDTLYNIVGTNRTYTTVESSLLLGLSPDYPPAPDYTYVKITVAVVIVGTPAMTLLVLCILRTRNIQMRKNFRKRDSYRMASFTYQSSISMRRYSNSPPLSDKHENEKPLKGHSFKFHNNRLSANNSKRRYDI